MKRKDAETGTAASDAELVVMRVLWEYGPSTVHDVVARLGQRKRAWAYNTVLTFLRRLVVKGYVVSETKSVAFQFAPRITREELVARRLRELARDLADGALSEIAGILAREMAADSRTKRVHRSRAKGVRAEAASSKPARSEASPAEATRADTGSTRVVVSVDAGAASVPAPHHRRARATQPSRRLQGRRRGKR